MIESTLAMATGFAVWSFSIWGVVLFLKSATKASQAERIQKLWARFSPLAAPIVGVATGPFAATILLAIASVSTDNWPEVARTITPFAGAFLGFGAGSVAATAHDLVLWKLEAFLKAKGQQ